MRLNELKLLTILPFFLVITLSLALSDFQSPFIGSEDYSSKKQNDIYEQSTENIEYNYCQAVKPNADAYTPLENAQLLQVQIVNRHGDRSPSAVFPTDHQEWSCPIQDNTFLSTDSLALLPNTDLARIVIEIPKNTPYAFHIWNGSCDVGQLTNKGGQQLHDLGKALREIYVDKLGFLSGDAEIDREVIYIRSTAIPRTKHSALFLLSGLFPVSANLSLPPWQIHNLPREIENMVSNPDACPLFKQIKSNITHEKPFEEYLKSNRKLRKHLKHIFGPPRERSFISEFDQVWTRICHDMPLPCEKDRPYRPGKKPREKWCVKTREVDQLLRNANFEERYLRIESPNSATFNRLGLGSFLAQIASGMVHRVNDFESGNPFGEPKLKIFSAHDDTTMGLLALLGAENFRYSPYASNFIFELWRLEKTIDNADPFDGYALRIIYNGITLDSRMCNFKDCPMERFLKIVEKVSPDHLERECIEV